MGQGKSLTEGNPSKLIFVFATPIFLGNLFQKFYSLIDMKIVGSVLGDVALASVGSVSILENLSTGFLNGLTLGFSVILARHYGSKDLKQVKKTVGGFIVLGGGMTCFLTLFVMLFLKQILNGLNVPADEFAMALQYIRVLMIGMIVTFSYNACANMLRAIGDAFTPLVILIFAAFLNIILDYIFVLGLRTGVAGAAIATVLAQFLSVILCLIRIRKHFAILHISKKDLKLSGRLAHQMMQSGLSMGFMSSLVNLGTLVLQTAINTLGTAVIVAHTAARKVFEIWNLPVSALGATMATYCGQNYGARQYDRIRKGIKSVLLLGGIWSILVFIMAHTISPVLIGFIASTQKEEIIYWGTKYLEFDMSFHIFCLLISVLRNSMQGFGDTTTPIFSSSIELVGKMVFAGVFVRYFGYWAIIWTEPVIWILMVIPLIVMTLRNPVITGQTSSDNV